MSLTTAGVAQENLPQIVLGERKPTVKKDVGPRALAVLQLTENGKSSLVPIAILINGKFWDATSYKANPVPMALEPGTVYEVERTGGSLGLFTVNSALHSRALNSQTPWIATGAWVPAGSEKPTTAHRAESAPVGIETTDAPPRLTRNPSEQTSPGNAPPASSTTPSTSAPSNTSPQPTGTASSGDEPPRLSRGASAPTSSSPGSTQTGQSQGQSQPGQNQAPNTSSPSGSSGSKPNQTNASQPAAGQTQPNQTQPNQTQPNQTQPNQTPSNPTQPGQTKSNQTTGSQTKASQGKGHDESIPASDSGADEAGRPRLRYGKPAESFADEDIPGYAKPGAETSPAPIAKSTKNNEPAKPVQSIPAISDAGGPTPHSFGFEWLKDEEGERRQQMEALAKDQVRAYLDAEAKASIIPATAPPKPTAAQAKRRASAKTREVILENEEMTAFDVWTTNQPVLVFSAEAHLPSPPASIAQANANSDLHYSVVLVAYPDIYNNLHKLYMGVTDKYHLDITPRLELVDAVDADGDGRGELLFREISDAGTGWVIYRPTADTLWKMFDSLSPE